MSKITANGLAIEEYNNLKNKYLNGRNIIKVYNTSAPNANQRLHYSNYSRNYLINSFITQELANKTKEKYKPKRIKKYSFSKNLNISKNKTKNLKINRCTQIESNFIRLNNINNGCFANVIIQMLFCFDNLFKIVIFKINIKIF